MRKTFLCKVFMRNEKFYRKLFRKRTFKKFKRKTFVTQAKNIKSVQNLEQRTERDETSQGEGFIAHGPHLLLINFLSPLIMSSLPSLLHLHRLLCPHHVFIALSLIIMSSSSIRLLHLQVLRFIMFSLASSSKCSLFRCNRSFRWDFVENTRNTLFSRFLVDAVKTSSRQQLNDFYHFIDQRHQKLQLRANWWFFSEKYCKNT